MTRTERTYYLMAGAYGLAQFFLTPVYPLFLQSRGLDLFEVNAMLAIYLITVFVFEIPTGAVADRFGRKASFVAACAVRCAAFTLYYFTRSFADCVIAELIDAVGTTLASGALEAWAVDGVRAEGDGRPLDRMFARAEMIARGALIVGGIACGYVAQAALGVPWLVAASIFAVTGIVGALVMREAPMTGEAGLGGAAALRANAAAAFRVVHAAPVLRLLFVLTLVAAFSSFPVWQLWQPRMEALSGAGPWLMGWVLALLNVSALAGSAVMPRLVGRLGRAPVLAASSLWRAITLAAAAGATRFPAAVTGLVLQEGASGVAMPIFTAWANEHIPAAQRATVLSVRSTFFTLGGASGLIALGLVARAYGIPAAWACAAALVALSVPGYVALGRLADADDVVDAKWVPDASD